MASCSIVEALYRHQFVVSWTSFLLWPLFSIWLVGVTHMSRETSTKNIDRLNLLSYSALVQISITSYISNTLFCLDFKFDMAASGGGLEQFKNKEKGMTTLA